MGLGVGVSARFIPCYVYVDAANVRQHLRDAGLAEEFNPGVAAGQVGGVRIAGGNLSPVRVFFYDAIDDQAPESDQKQRRQEYLQRVERLPGTKVQTGYVRRRRASKKGPLEQKAVDVQLAVDALEAAQSGVVGAIALVTGDGDFAPLIEAIQRAGPYVVVLAFKEKLSSELEDVADQVIHLTIGDGGWPLA